MNGDKNFYKKVNEIFNNKSFTDTVILCPPFIYMPYLEIRKKNVVLGAQDVSIETNNKSTGQTSPKMMSEFDVKYALVGHSERRANGETDEMVAQKVKNSVDNNIVPIVCVGEKTKEEKFNLVEEQVRSALSLIKKGKIIFAYEPVWAIGTGEIPTVEKIDEALKVVRKTAKKSGFEVAVLYGGSMNESNQKVLKTTKADGFLIGGVSLKLDEFMSIVEGE